MDRAGFAGSSDSWAGWSITIKTTNKSSPEVHEQAVRLVLETKANVRRAGRR
jgi:hypothetical protein